MNIPPCVSIRKSTVKPKMLKIIFALVGISFVSSSGFLSEQKRSPRVAGAYAEKQAILSGKLKALNLDLARINILLVAYKDEKELDLFVKSKNEQEYKKLATYPVCRTSGRLGPKRSQYDGQIPEGFYSITKFNPASSYYLSLGISYPNGSDLFFSKGKNPGGDIYIHGECVTIGCLPMTNDKIKEIYIYAIEARNNGQMNIPVYIFPFRFTDEKMKLMNEKYKTENDLLDFWKNLKTGYDKFYKDFKELSVKTDPKNGHYIIR